MPAIPVLVQLLFVFSLVIIANAKKLHLGVAAVAGGIIFAFFRGIPFPRIASVLAGEILDPDTMLLLLLMIAIMAFSGAMKRAGALESFNDAIRVISPTGKVALPLAPLLIGTLPMPGGAILSAPLVEALDPDGIQGPESLSAINYWFRHTLELCWPLYPAFILTSTLTNLPVGRLMLLNAYAPVCLFTLGSLFLLKRNAPAAPVQKPPTAPLESRIATVVRGFGPLAIVLGCYALLDAVWKVVAPGLALPKGVMTLLGRYMPILAGIAAGSVYLAAKNRGKGIFRSWVSSGSLRLVAIILGIRCFSSLLEAGGIAVAVSAELDAFGISPLLVAVILPFIAGMVTGVGFGYVGLAFPIVLGLFQTDSGMPFEAVVVVAGAAGYAGMMLSPLHVCMVLSAEHFRTNAATTIRRIAFPLALFMLGAGAYAALLSGIR